ncbi:hypothetical protein TVAG_258520 [Trichomonas vaginalis G3]|uniref:Nuclear transport factor 2 domain-containing protein n=1 Tax=Trichomonas vaginalis (strain ATCC PRA-98 / G3) TaxID=412133 RepID=A2E956_TRIV3|nr:NTF2-like family [Trichomonas vaginalis G3]EAY10850.1 hypothetical protein TVAG_258520 [Trichomonas vaginalis G3]KAI5519938.1 NTF2-like family [Trichomonas vaginalis G3]|eukprot:XP_001323073.1 hypothetical protein [Trichomonas vaginalis G3]
MSEQKQSNYSKKPYKGRQDQRPYPNKQYSKYPKKEEEEDIKEDDISDESDDYDQPDLRHGEQCYVLGQFKSLVIDPKAFPTNPFIINFLHTSWYNIRQIHKYYDVGSQFSVSVDHSKNFPAMREYEQYTTNLITGQQCVAHGGPEIADLQFHLFPKGFFAHVMSMNYRNFDNDIFAVVLHGVFLGITSHVFGFDRSFTIQAAELGFSILSDHLYIHYPPN